jgi:hypothetical protein
VTQITKHDGEQEGEGDHGKEPRIDFLICCDSIGIDDGLVSFRELVCAMERWRFLACPNFLKNRGNAGARSLLRV